MSHVIRVSKSGKDVLTETDINNLIFSSEYNTLKYYSEGTATVSVNGSSDETEITHSLGYVPFFLVYHNTPTDSSKFSNTPFVFEGMGLYVYIDAYATSSKLYLAVQTNSAVADIDFYYKIFKNSTDL